MNIDQTDEIKDRIEGLNRLGHNIVYFPELNEYYVFSSFVPAEGVSFQHMLKGKKINKILTKQQLSITAENIAAHLELIQIVARRFHSKFLWLQYAAL